MRVLVACEFSGIVRDAFIARGYNAWSCDLLPSERPGPHILGDCLKLFGKRYRWDLLICHPPCTHLSVSGARWCTDHWVKRKNKPSYWHNGSEKRLARERAVEFAKALWNANVKQICLENPVSVLSTYLGKPHQIINPWEHGHGEVKKTCLWLKGLPLLRPTCVLEERRELIHRMAPSETRWADRSRTYEGIARAMAAQWG